MKKISFLILSCIFITTNGYRLSKDVLPEHYKLEVITYLGEKDNFDFEGKVWIQTQCVNPTQNITLHSKDLTIHEDEITVQDITSSQQKKTNVKKILFDKDNDFLTIILEDSLNSGHKYEIFIGFNATLNDGLAGFYRSSYLDKKTKQKKWTAVTQFEAISARTAFPCFDEPEMKATFDISIGRKDGYTAISNMPLRTTEPIKEKEGFYWDRFEKSVPMSTYLVAYIVSDFDYKTGDMIKNNNVTFRIWARKDAIDQVDFARYVGPKVLEYYEKFFDIKYPLPKQDMVALSDFSAGAMENWGLITYREAYLLYDPNVSSKSNQHGAASVIAHELAHQWFGNLVTMKWWTDLWLNEGFATYMAAVAVEHLFPQWNSLEEESASNLLNVFSFDALKNSHPVSVPIGDPKEIDEIFDTISYKKGSSLIRMMMMFLGEEVLRKGVSNYLKKHQYKNAEQDDLWESLTEEAHKTGALDSNLTVKTIMDTWTLQTGYPVIRAIRNYGDKTVAITQTRFLRDVIKPKDKHEPCWWVPLSYSTQSHPEFNVTIPKTWLSCPMEEKVIKNLPDNKDWIIFNNHVAGIYRVNYDIENWRRITETLLSKDYYSIPTLNRIQLINDAADLAFVGDLEYTVFFDLVKYLGQEEEYLPWKTTLAKTAKLSSYLQKTSVYGEFKSYMKQLLTPIFSKIGGFEIPQTRSDKLDSIKLQILVTSRSCKYDVANCVSAAKELFNKWMENSDQSNPVSTDLRSVVYCTALRHGGEKEWEFLWKQYQNSNVATEKNVILNSLGCTRELWLLSRYLDWTLKTDSGIRVQDITGVFGSVARNDVGYYIAKKFFFENIKNIAKFIQPNNRKISRYLSSLASQIYDNKEYQELKDLINENKKEFEAAKKGVEQSLETIEINIQWQNRHAEDIKKLLPNYVKKE